MKATAGRTPADPVQAFSLLRPLPFFDGVPDDELRAVAGSLHVESFRPGESIVREGEPGDAWYLIGFGRAAVVGRDMVGLEVQLAALGPGAHFGEMALVTGAPRSATVRATEHVEAFALGRAAFLALEAGVPEVAERFRRHVERVGVQAFLRKASVFAHLPDDAVERLAGQMRIERVLPGRAVVRRGDLGDRLYLVRSGRLEVVRGEKRLRMLGPGDCFGEVALLAPVRRTATVLALEPGEVLSLGKEEFDAVVAQESGLRQGFAELVRIRAGEATARKIAGWDPLTTLMPHAPGRGRHRYWWMLVAGLALFGLLSFLTTRFDSAPLLFATIVLGSFLAPVVYVVHLAESGLLGERPWRLAVTFLLGAGLGIPIAVLVHQLTGAHRGDIASSLLIGLGEEPAKLAGVAWLLLRSRSRFQMDGVVYGAAAGMGFAAFENVMYAQSYAAISVSEMLSTLWVRTLLSPFGHGTWTAIVCAAIWRAKGGGRPRVDAFVVGAFLFSVLLHGLWDWAPVPGVFQIGWFVVIGVVGLQALQAIVERANREEERALVALNPRIAELAGADGHPPTSLAAAPTLTCAGCGQTAPPGTRYCPRCGAALRLIDTPEGASS